MSTRVVIPHGEDKIIVELTVKEAMALSGQQFINNPDVKPNATRKLIDAIDRKLEVEKR